MKVYIFTDMEGIGGIVNWEQVMREGSRYSEGRVLLTEEVNAAVSGVFDGGAQEVVVCDGHATWRNFVLDRLHPKARYYMGNAPGLVRMPYIEGSDILLCIGYHAKANTSGAILSHTMDGKTASFRVNGREVGELGMDALWAGLHDVGVGMVSGDNHLAREARELLGDDVETAVVKEGLARFGGLVMAPEKSCELIRKAAASAVKKAVKNKPKPFRLPPPYRVERDFFNQKVLEDVLTFIPGAERVGSSTIAVEGDDLNQLMFSVLLYAPAEKE